jgi:hypothetical protein
VKTAGKNDVSCGSDCTGSGSADGFGCGLASPGIPAVTNLAAGSCPPGSGYGGTTLVCNPGGTGCYCASDSQCPSGKCIPSANNGNCSGCTGSGTADYRGCEATATIPACSIYIGCVANTTCSYPTCYCTSDAACESGHCIPSSKNSNCVNCTGTGTDDGHGCESPPTSIPCAGTGGSFVCNTTLSPAPIPNSAHTACLCVADSDCPTGKCANVGGQCTGTCTGSTAAGTYDVTDCQLFTSQ